MTQPTPFRVPPHLRLPAVARLLGLGADLAPARRFIAEAPVQSVDLDLLWAFGPPPEPVGGPLPPPRRGFLRHPATTDHIQHAALLVPGAGRVGMLFTSVPTARHVPGFPDAGLVELIRAVCEGARTILGQRLALVQALVESPQAWFRDSLASAGFTSVGRLLYMRRANEPPIPAVPARAQEWPDGVRVVSARELGDLDTQNRVLVDLLDRSYEGTLDCPELCGLRRTADILESHRASGRHDPSLWWLAFQQERAVGCALFNPYPEQGSIELVYLGLAPEVRGVGLATRLMAFGLERVAQLPMTRVACAVDERNAPARRLYDRLGFSRFDTREAWVRAV